MTMRRIIGLAAVCFLFACGIARGSGRSADVDVQMPSEGAFQALDEADRILGQLADRRNEAAGEIHAKAQPLREKLERLRVAANSFLSRELTEADLPAVGAHNRECEAVLHSELAEFVEAAEAVLLKAARQIPSVIKNVAQELADSGDYDATEDGTTRCSEFLDAYAETAYGYNGFQKKTANDIVEALRGSSEWRAIHDSKTGAGEGTGLQERLQAAQRYANDGCLVVIGLKNGGAAETGGHLAVIIPGALQASEKWEAAGLPKMLPRIAQAGDQTFAGQHLGFGISPASAKAGELVIYVRKP
jgi:hypothetical protein